MNVSDLLDIKSAEDSDSDESSIAWYKVVLKENNIYGLPTKPDGLPCYYMLNFYGNEIYIALDEDEEMNTTFDITKFKVERTE